MSKKILLFFLLSSMILAAGCVQKQAPKEQATRPAVSGSSGGPGENPIVSGPGEQATVAVEDQAINEIEQEMDQAIENITLEDIESGILE